MAAKDEARETTRRQRRGALKRKESRSKSRRGRSQATKEAWSQGNGRERAEVVWDTSERRERTRLCSSPHGSPDVGGRS